MTGSPISMTASRKKIRRNGMGSVTLITMLLILLKAFGVIDLPWFLVLFGPLIGIAGYMLFLVVIAGFFVVLARPR